MDMANPVVIVDKIIQTAFAIKDAVETVRDNKEDCLEVERRVVRISDLLSLLTKGSSETMKHYRAMTAPLQDLQDAVGRGLEAVTACQGRNVLFLFCAAGKNAKRLRRVQDVISHRMMVAVFACSVAVFVATEGLHRAQASIFSDDEHLPSPTTMNVVVPDNAPPSPPPPHRLTPPKTTIEVADEKEKINHQPPTHEPPPPPPPPPCPTASVPPPTRAHPLETNVVPPFPEHHLSSQRPEQPPTPLPNTTAGPSSISSPRPPNKQPPSTPLATFVGPPVPKHLSSPPPNKQPPPPPPPLPCRNNLSPHVPKHQPPRPPAHPTPPPPHHHHRHSTSTAPSSQQVPPPANKAPLLPHHSSTQTTMEISPSRSSSRLSAHDDVSGKSEIKNEGKKIPSRSKASSTFLLGLTNFSLPEMKAATQNFADENKIGSCDFCTVYKGVLHGGLEVAIKDFKDPPQSLVARISAEFLLASQLQRLEEEEALKRSENIIRVLGYGHEFIWKHRSFEAHIFMVEEYMPNGSMDNIIYGSQLDWSLRFKIIQGLAQGLQYLHEQNIVHMNVKPTNIMLDSYMNPKITEFGISRRLDKPTIHDSNIAGTLGYMPPEYILEGTLSAKYDVYSFGVTLLETISGMCKDEEAHHQASIQWAWKVRGYEQIDELFDRSLSDKSQIMEIHKCLEIGLLCTQFMPEERPTMARVLEMMKGSKGLPTPNQPEYTKERATATKSARRKIRGRR